VFLDEIRDGDRRDDSDAARLCVFFGTPDELTPIIRNLTAPAELCVVKVNGCFALCKTLSSTGSIKRQHADVIEHQRGRL
jgi:hypothetical protein